jgi:hypothetical protein
MAEIISQQAKSEDLRGRLVALDAKLSAVRARLDDRVLLWQPPEGGWSIGQVMEHLCVSHDSYLDPMRALVGNRPAGAAREDNGWKPSFAGRLLVSGLKGERKLPSPRKYRVGPHARPEVARELASRHDIIARVLESAGTYDWRRIRVRSPVLPLLRMNLGDCFEVLVVHEERHFRQIDRLLAAQRA